MKILKISLSAVYWLVVLFLLWGGYRGDQEIYRASTVRVNHTPEFDVAVTFALALIVYAVACAIWWAAAWVKNRGERVQAG